MAAGSSHRATVADLYREEDRAELIGGRIVRYRPAGCLPGAVAGEVGMSLHQYAKETGHGDAYVGRLAYVIPELPSGRESFSPDASYYVGPHPTNPMAFIEGPPTFAVEVRNEEDYGPDAETAMAAKRADYFAAGTLVVWDVDCLIETVVVYRASASTQPVVYRQGDTAEAEPAVPGWRMAVRDIFSV